MKTTILAIVAAAALGVPAYLGLAQDTGEAPGNGGPPPQEDGNFGPRRGGPPGGPQGRRADMPPRNPVIAALDANQDHVISAEEIANAVAVLKSLDKNNDGQLTPDEIRPQMQNRRGWDDDRQGQRGPRGQRGRFGPGQR